MVNKVYIVWCKLNKSTPKFDVGIHIDKSRADKIANATASMDKSAKVWVEEYRLSKVYKGKH
ncbi:hypothetical protein LCGC14_0403950 [marine sediment metagenome]|uniref:Uncharacterized protein n=1 Tax=marine sediment metagenome TaxID=412755 RepID=A0A0F9VHU3_9ZZZZ